MNNLYNEQDNKFYKDTIVDRNSNMKNTEFLSIIYAFVKTISDKEGGDE